ncbi:proline racemase family protein [Roseateles sp. DB2]|uniref:proline racemase family protein n=1 Tax=Roseateles sp. DB2 TaxID=3453717 RepID=UPI003EEB8ABA
MMDHARHESEGSALGRWCPAEGALRLRSIDCHTGGEPLRVIIDGFPALQGQTMLARRRDCLERFDNLRQALMWEPRGHADMYGAVITPPERSDSVFGVLFLHNEGYSTMCGHAMPALAKLAIESGLVPAPGPRTRLNIDAPCGQIRLEADCLQREGRPPRVGRVRFWNVPSFVLADRQSLLVEGLGRVHYALAYGGAFYAYVDAASLGLSLATENHARLIEAGRQIKRAIVSAGTALDHPDSPDLAFLYGTIFTGAALGPGADYRNVCIFADGELDRSPTGSGVSGFAALLYARGQLPAGQRLTIESVLGSRFEVWAEQPTRCGPHPAIVPVVEGEAHVTGCHEFFFHPDDPLVKGFLLR